MLQMRFITVFAGDEVSILGVLIQESKLPLFDITIFSGVNK
jgi:hypothetical protein